MNDLIIVVDLRKDRIRIHKNTLHALGDPSYVSLIINPDEYSLCIQCSSVDDKTAHHMRQRIMNSKSSYELYSKSLVKAFLDLCPEWDSNTKYKLDGVLIPSEKMIKFSMKDAVWQDRRGGAKP